MIPQRRRTNGIGLFAPVIEIHRTDRIMQIGDDGLEGIQLAQGDATGEAFLSVQRMALALRERGVVLAVLSKIADGSNLAVGMSVPAKRRPEAPADDSDAKLFRLPRPQLTR